MAKTFLEKPQDQYTAFYTWPAARNPFLVISWFFYDSYISLRILGIEFNQKYDNDSLIFSQFS